MESVVPLAGAGSDPVAVAAVSPAPCLPDYPRSVAAIVPALLGTTDAAWLAEPARDAAAVVLLVLDGLGWRAFTDAPDSLRHLATFAGGPITTVLPATTSAALTSITTGHPPAAHGVTGYRMLVDDEVLNVLRWQHEAKGVRPPEPSDVQRLTPFLGRSVPVVAQAEHRGSGFTGAHLRGAPFVGWRTTSVLVEQCRRLVSAGNRLVYAYYPGVDEVAHEFGLHDGAYAGELAFVDDLVARLQSVLPADTALVVTADHGQTHLEPEAWVELDDIATLVARQAGDARFRHLYAVRGANRELAAAARDRFGGVAWVRTRKELLAEGWLGAGAAGPVPGRIGDVVLAPFAEIGFVDPALPRERGLRSAHGAPTENEVRVPLLAARGTA